MLVLQEETSRDCPLGSSAFLCRQSFPISFLIFPLAFENDSGTKEERLFFCDRIARDSIQAKEPIVQPEKVNSSSSLES
ncbi:hypothetical protein ACLB2K_046399 [Fragaria x ananassa]